MDRETLLQKYLEGELTEKERYAFDMLLDTDPDFKKEVEFQTDVKRAVTAEEDESFIEMLSDFESEARTKAGNTNLAELKERKALTKWLVAASIVFISGLAYFFANQTASTQDLYAQNFKPYRNVVHPITRGEEAVDKKTKAFSSYAQGDYSEAVLLFTELYDTDKEAYYLFYEANALIQLDRAEEAIPLLQEHLKTQDSLTDKSSWYLAMAYLQIDDMESAKKALKLVVENKAYKADDAKRLLDEF